MTEESNRVALPAFLLHRLEGFRFTQGDQTNYVIRDKVGNRSFDLEARQFFTLRALANCDTFFKIELAFIERFGREITQAEFDRFCAYLADQKLFSVAAAEHPLLAPFARGTTPATVAASAAESGVPFVAVSAPTSAPVLAALRARALAATVNESVAAAPDEPKPSATLPAGVQGAPSLARAAGADTPTTSTSRSRRYWKHALALGLLPLLLLPYAYEPSGNFVVSTARRAEVGNTGAATVQIDIIESDIQHVKIGATVRARPTAWFNDEFQGKVTLIDSNVTSKNVIRVTATFDSLDGYLIPGMTGQAKIESTTMPAWKAFMQAITRFVRLHLWSWMP